MLVLAGLAAFAATLTGKRARWTVRGIDIEHVFEHNEVC